MIGMRMRVQNPRDGEAVFPDIVQMPMPPYVPCDSLLGSSAYICRVSMAYAAAGSALARRPRLDAGAPAGWARMRSHAPLRQPLERALRGRVDT